MSVFKVDTVTDWHHIACGVTQEKMKTPVIWGSCPQAAHDGTYSFPLELNPVCYYFNTVHLRVDGI